MDDLRQTRSILIPSSPRASPKSLLKSQAQVNQAQRAIDEANHNVIQLTTQALLAQQELDRAKYLVETGAEAPKPRKYWTSASSS
jgi:HlyD family secretion protein